jgi:hypothetical protein
MDSHVPHIRYVGKYRGVPNMNRLNGQVRHVRIHVRYIQYPPLKKIC